MEQDWKETDRMEPEHVPWWFYARAIIGGVALAFALRYAAKFVGSL